MSKRNGGVSQAKEDALNAAQAAFTVNPLFMAPQLKHALQAQESVLDNMESFANAWFARRHDAMRTMFDTSRRIITGGENDPARIMAEVIDWQTRAMERLAEDATDCGALITRCASALAANEGGAAEETVETGKDAAKPAKATQA